jgi:hypothetical protein
MCAPIGRFDLLEGRYRPIASLDSRPPGWKAAERMVERLVPHTFDAFMFVASVSTGRRPMSETRF